MSYLFDAIQVCLLAVIAFELFFLRRDVLIMSKELPRSGEESSKGQTINVNVGTPVLKEGEAAAKRVEEVVVDEKSPETAEEATEQPSVEDERSRRAEERARMASATRAAPNGLLVKKCPSCGMDNTAMRSECFNCGAAL